MKLGRLTDTEFSLSPSLFTGSHCSFSLMLNLIELNQKTINNFFLKKHWAHSIYQVGGNKVIQGLHSQGKSAIYVV